MALKMGLRDASNPVRLYLEAHVTVEPREGVTYEEFAEQVTSLGWKASKFEHDDVDGIAGMWFLSYKSDGFFAMQIAMGNIYQSLNAAKYKILRAKIENTVWDTKYGDTF